MSETPIAAQYPGQDPRQGDGPVSPAPATGTVGEVGPVRTLATVAIVAASSYLALVLLQAVLVWDAQARWLDAAEDGRSAMGVTTTYGLMGLAFVPVGIFAYVATCLFLWRARTNVDRLSPGSRHARRRGWVWAGWIVPVVSFWFPYQVVRDVVRRRRDAPTLTLGWWWGLWLASLLALRVEATFVPYDRINPNAAGTVGQANVVTTLLTLAAFVLWVRLVRDITRDQEGLLRSADRLR